MTGSNLFCHQAMQVLFHVSGPVAMTTTIEHVGNTSAVRGSGTKSSKERYQNSPIAAAPLQKNQPSVLVSTFCRHRCHFRTAASSPVRNPRVKMNISFFSLFFGGGGGGKGLVVVVVVVVVVCVGGGVVV